MVLLVFDTAISATPVSQLITFYLCIGQIRLENNNPANGRYWASVILGWRAGSLQQRVWTLMFVFPGPTNRFRPPVRFQIGNWEPPLRLHYLSHKRGGVVTLVVMRSMLAGRQR